MMGQPNASLYVNRLIGLHVISQFQSTSVQLDEPRIIPVSDSSSNSSFNANDENDEDDNNGNNSGGEME